MCAEVLSKCTSPGLSRRASRSAFLEAMRAGPEPVSRRAPTLITVMGLLAFRCGGEFGPPLGLGVGEVGAVAAAPGEARLPRPVADGDDVAVRVHPHRVLRRHGAARLSIAFRASSAL